MFITFDKKQFYVRADNGLILSTKSVPEGIVQAVLNGNQVLVTTAKSGTLVFQQVGSTPVFMFHRRY